MAAFLEGDPAADFVYTQTIIGSARESTCVLAVNSKDGTASALKLRSPDGSEYFLWVDDTGDLRVGSGIDLVVSPNAAGTVVGAQS